MLSLYYLLNKAPRTDHINGLQMHNCKLYQLGINKCHRLLSQSCFPLRSTHLLFPKFCGRQLIQNKVSGGLCLCLWENQSCKQECWQFLLKIFSRSHSLCLCQWQRKGLGELWLQSPDVKIKDVCFFHEWLFYGAVESNGRTSAPVMRI